VDHRGGLTVAYVLGTTLLILLVAIAAARLLNHHFGGELAAWVQAVGAVLAIVAGFATANFQLKVQQEAVMNERRALAQAAHLLGYEALETMSERLNMALTPRGPSKRLALHGDRTTEMIVAMREFDTTKLPASMLSDFIRLRSHVYAINQRISDIFESEEHGSESERSERKKTRYERLRSSVRVRAEAVILFDRLQQRISNEFGGEAMTITTGQFLTDYSVLLADS